MKTNSAFQSTTTSGKNCITVFSLLIPSKLECATSNYFYRNIYLTASDVSNHLSIPKPDVVILETNYVTDKPRPPNNGTQGSVSVPSPGTVNIVLNESTITPMEKPEALDKWAVIPRQQRKGKMTVQNKFVMRS